MGLILYDFRIQDEHLPGPRWLYDDRSAYLTRFQIAVAQDDGLLGCAAVQHRHGPGAALDRRRRAQWHLFDQPVGRWPRSSFSCPARWSSTSFPRAFLKRAGCTPGRREAFGPFHGFIAGWTYWIYTVFYFPGLLLASASMAAYIMGGPRRLARAEPDLSADGLSGHASGRRGPEHHRAEHRQVAAECGRRGNVCAAADAGGYCRDGLLAARLRHALHRRTT